MKQIEAGSKRQRRHHRVTSAERLEMIERFHRSGMTRKAFADLEGIPRSTLDWWLYLVRQRSEESTLVFREVQVSVPTAPAAAWAMEVVSPEGLTIRCREALSGSELVRLLRGVRC